MNTEVLRRQDLLLPVPFPDPRPAAIKRRGSQAPNSRGKRENSRVLRDARFQAPIAREGNATSFKPAPTKPSLINPFTVAAAREQKWEVAMLALVAAIALVGIFSGLLHPEAFAQRVVELLQAFRG